MANEAYISLIGFVATQPKIGQTKTGSQTLSMRVGWTPRAIDRATGQWSDLPSSFATVQCYRKVAEHASVCLRKGDPIVVRGTLRVREYTDQNGQRRSSVEITAESVGHDMARGLSTYSRLPVRAELTAEEYRRSLAAAERNPLPGDAGQAAADGGGEPGGKFGGVAQHAGDPDLGQVDPADGELLEDEEYDDPETGDVPTMDDEVLEPAGASA